MSCVHLSGHGACPKCAAERVAGIGSDSYPSQGIESTSQSAYRSIDGVRGKLRRSVYEVIVRLAEAGQFGATGEEVEELAELGGNTVRPRLKELEADRFVRKGVRTRKTRSGRAAIVWEPVRRDAWFDRPPPVEPKNEKETKPAEPLPGQEKLL